MSLAALSLLLGYVAVHGTTEETYVVVNGVRRADEGTAAHLFQLLMGGQLLVIAWFAVRWLPTRTREAIAVLCLQFVAGASAFATLYFFEHQAR
jgi:hypothetical protein